MPTINTEQPRFQFHLSLITTKNQKCATNAQTANTDQYNN